MSNVLHGSLNANVKYEFSAPWSVASGIFWRIVIHRLSCWTSLSSFSVFAYTVSENLIKKFIFHNIYILKTWLDRTMCTIHAEWITVFFFFFSIILIALLHRPGNGPDWWETIDLNYYASMLDEERKYQRRKVPPRSWWIGANCSPFRR